MVTYKAIEDIHQMNAQVMISIWPRIGQDSALGKELEAKGHLFEGLPSHQDKVYDAFPRRDKSIGKQSKKACSTSTLTPGGWMAPNLNLRRHDFTSQGPAVRQRNRRWLVGARSNVKVGRL